MDNDDFFGVEYISNEPIPSHMLPKNPLSNAIKSSKVEKNGLSFIESSFFNGIENSIEEKVNTNNNKNDLNKDENDEDFFTENFYGKLFFFFIKFNFIKKNF